jgi:hypothetical protein
LSVWMIQNCHCIGIRLFGGQSPRDLGVIRDRITSRKHGAGCSDRKPFSGTSVVIIRVCG